MRNTLATLIALVAAGYIGSLFIGPGDDLSTLQWIGFMIIGIPVVLGVMLLLGSATLSESLHEECEPEDHRAT